VAASCEITFLHHRTKIKEDERKGKSGGGGAGPEFAARFALRRGREKGRKKIVSELLGGG